MPGRTPSYIVTTPVGRRDLAGAEYATVLVSLGSPRIGMVTGGDVTIGASPHENDSVPDGTTKELQGAPQRNRTPDTRKRECYRSGYHPECHRKGEYSQTFRYSISSSDSY